jgi:antitoxin component YwqK of YwqJK toxin-antitoxin module
MSTKIIFTKLHEQRKLHVLYLVILLLFICFIGKSISADKPTPEKKRPQDYTGVWTVTNPDGTKYEGNFVNGKAHGTTFIWDNQGRLLRQGLYNQGKTHGAWTWFHENGDIWFIRIKSNGQTIREIHYENQKVVADGEYRNNKPWNGTFYGGKNTYHELRDGKPWNGDFWTPLPKPESSRPKEWEPFSVIHQLPETPEEQGSKKVTFKDGKIVQKIPEEKSQIPKSPKILRFDINWPIDNGGRWFSDYDLLRYAYFQLKDVNDGPNLRDIKYKVNELAKALARPRPPSPFAWQVLIDNKILKDGMTIEEADGILGHPTDRGYNGYNKVREDVMTRKEPEDNLWNVGWYYNFWDFHVAPYLTAKIRDNKLYDWEITQK